MFMNENSSNKLPPIYKTYNGFNLQLVELLVDLFVFYLT